jgi:hypothetical protein
MKSAPKKGTPQRDLRDGRLSNLSIQARQGGAQHAALTAPY